MAELDRNRWQGLLNRLGARDPDLRTFRELQGAWSEPHRYYHTVSHLLGCLKLLDALRGHFHRADEAELALWFHDAIYRTRSTQNEADSADWARRFALEAGLSADSAGRIAAMIEATAHGDGTPSGDTALLCDIDLAILGFPAEAYDDFEQRIRREYHWVDEPVFIAKRTQILRDFLQRPRIYQSDALQPLLEDNARANLQRWIARFERRLAGSKAGTAGLRAQG